MNKKEKLSTSMSIAQFESGYWYASDLKNFAKMIGVQSTRALRKDQLEKIIVQYLSSGELPVDSKTKIINKKTSKDYETTPLALDTPIKNYCSNKITKSFIMLEAQKQQPGYPKKSAVWYWLNRWRKEQLSSNKNITYGDLIKHYLVLSNKKERLPRIPSTSFNNFISDYLEAKEGNRSEAIKAWETLKKLKTSKTYTAWRKHHS